MDRKRWIICLIILTIVAACKGQKTACSDRNNRLERVAIIGHETTFMMKLLAVAKEQFHQVYFVPMREHVQNKEQFPILPEGITVFRGPNKFEELLRQKPEGILTFQFEYGQKLAELPLCDRPGIIILASRTSVNQYEALPLATQSAFSSSKVISFADSRLKQPDSFHGVGASILKVFKALQIDNSQHILLLGYGQTGQGIAHYLQQQGYPVGVSDIDSAKLVIALHNGIPVGSFQSLAKNADVVIDATGDTSTFLTPITADYFQKPKVYVVSTSTNDKGILIENGYQNAHGTVFSIDPSHGMVNMYYGVGGSDDTAMRTTGFSCLYLLENYPEINKELIPINPYLWKLAPSLESKIGEAFLKEPQLLGGPSIPHF